MTGVANFHETLVLKDDGSMHMTQKFQGINAVGTPSMLTYTGTQEWIQTINVGPAFVAEVLMALKLVRSGEAPTLTTMPDDQFFRSNLHTTVNANGEVTSSFFKPTMECR